jgi:hypothetical protein
MVALSSSASADLKLTSISEVIVSFRYVPCASGLGTVASILRRDRSQGQNQVIGVGRRCGLQATVIVTDGWQD